MDFQAWQTNLSLILQSLIVIGWHQHLTEIQIMEDQLKDVKKCMTWNRRAFRIIGLWPLDRTFWLFYSWFLYSTLHLFMGFVDLALSFGDLKKIIANFTETALETMIIIKIIILKHSNTFRETVIMAEDEIKEKHFLEIKEKEIYRFYNGMAMYFFKWAMPYAYFSSALYHLKPIEIQVKAALANETLPWSLPYRSHLPFEVTKLTTYIFVYVYQAPMIYFHGFQTAFVSFLVTLVFNASGHLAILARRIRNIQPSTSRNWNIEVGNSVQRYLEIVRFAKLIDKSFSFLLLEELVITVVCLALASYNLLVNTDFEDSTPFVSFTMYASTMIALTFAYCFAGEYLITESINVHDAYYYCDWLELPSSHRKSLILCLIGTEKPLALRAGGFYTFSLAAFTTIMKSSMAYVSALRTLVL